MTNNFDLQGRVALVTGASSGIGQAISEALAAAGCRVAVVARRKERLDETVARICASGHEAFGFVYDLENRTGLSDLVDNIKGVLGAPDILVNCAGINLREPVDEVSLASWDRTININLSVPFFLARLLVPTMRERGWGRIINIASLQSRRAFPNGIAYGASKGGVEQLTRAMAEVWSVHGITCNAIAPGFFPTELTAPVFGNDNTRDWAASQTTIGRNGELEDLHGAAVFLASDASSYITGQVLFVDGGFTAR